MAPQGDQSQAPATKQDIAMLMEQIGTYYSKTEQEIEDLRTEMVEWKEEVKRHFDFVAENIRHDCLGANRDEIEVIKDRVARLEQHTGLATSRAA